MWPQLKQASLHNSRGDSLVRKQVTYSVASAACRNSIIKSFVQFVGFPSRTSVLSASSPSRSRMI